MFSALLGVTVPTTKYVNAVTEDSPSPAISYKVESSISSR